MKHTYKPPDVAVTLERQCPRCEYWHVIEVGFKQLAEYNNGKPVQEAFPELNLNELEFIKTGYCPECQKALFGKFKSEKIQSIEAVLPFAE